MSRDTVRLSVVRTPAPALHDFDEDSERTLQWRPPPEHLDDGPERPEAAGAPDAPGAGETPGALAPSVDTKTRGPGLLARAFSLVLLAGTALALCWLGVNVYYMVTDAWVAPLHLSPDNDKVIGLRLKHARQLAELERVEAEIGRIDGELEGIDTAIGRLSAVLGSSRDSMTWEADVHAEKRDGLDRIIDNLRDQKALLTRLHERQQGLTDAARADFEAGLIDRHELETAEQALDSLTLSLRDNDRKLAEARMQRRESAVASKAYRAGARDIAATGVPEGRMPEIAAGEEHELRLELELIKLHAERRNLSTLRAVAAERLASERAILDEIQGRPLYRALHASTHVAFVPYDELDDVKAGARVMACTWGIFQCHRVGAVAEVLPGEVMAEDPWGDLVRGQYAILSLDDADAIRESILRVRP